jgi:hypothetical protein
MCWYSCVVKFCALELTKEKHCTNLTQQVMYVTVFRYFPHCAFRAYGFCALELTKGKHCTNLTQHGFVCGGILILPTLCFQSIWIYLPMKYQFLA